MANIKETYFIKNNANAKEGTTLIFYSDGTYSTLNNVNIDSFRRFYNLETNNETKAKIFDGSRKEVQDAIVESMEGRRRVEFANSNSALYQKNVASNTNNMGRTAIAEGMNLNNRNNVGRTAIAKGTTLDDRNNIDRANARNNTKVDNSKVDPTKEKDDNRWKYALGGVAAVGAIGGAAYLLNKDKEDEKDKDSMEGKDWKYYLENAKDSNQKTAMTRIYNILERLNVSQNWMRANDGTSKWGLTPEQALSMYTYFNNLSTEELAQIYNGETVNVDSIMEEANQGMIAMSFFYANDTVGDTTIAELFNDQASKNVISDFTQIQARYNRATNDKERTEIAKEKKQMYYDYFINNSSSKYVDVSSVPGASFVINTMFPVDFVRYFRSSADLGEFDEILVTGRVREDGTIEHRSKVDSACGGLKADLEKYNEDIRELKAEYNAKKSNGFMKVSGKTEYEKLIEDTYDTQLILDMMTQNLKTIDKYPANVNTFNSTIDGERRLIPVNGNSYSSSTGSSSYRPSNNGGVNTPASAPAESKQEFEANTPEEAAKKAVESGAPQEMVDKATEVIKRENEKAKEEAEKKADDLHNTYQGYYDDVFNGDKSRDEAVDDADNAYKNGEISKDEHDKILGVIADANHDKKDQEKGEELDGTTTGGEITNEGSEVNGDGSIDIDVDGDGEKEHIPAHNPNDPNNPYNMPDYADGAFDVEKNNEDDEIVFENGESNQTQNESTLKTPNTGEDNTNGDASDYGEVEISDVGTSEITHIPGVPLYVDENGNYTTEKPAQSQETNQQPDQSQGSSQQPIEQNPISDEELGDMTFSGGATSVGTSGGEVTDFTEDQLVNQVNESNDTQEVEIDSSIVSGTTGGEESTFTEDQLVNQFYSDYNEGVETYDDSQEVMSFDSFAQNFYDEAASQEEVAESENVKTLK